MLSMSPSFRGVLIAVAIIPVGLLSYHGGVQTMDYYKISKVLLLCTNAHIVSV